MTNLSRPSLSRDMLRGLKLVGLALALILGLPSPGAGAAPPGKGKPPGNLSVTTEIFDLDSGNQVCTIASDGGGIYQDNVDGVSSILTANTCNGLTWGDWRFDSRGLSSPNGRFVNEGFFQNDLAVPGDAPAPYEGHQPQKSWMNVQCTCSAGQDMYTMTAGQTIICPLLNNFNDAGTGYGWGYSPAKSFTGFPETTDAQITCNLAAGGHCVDWFIDPIGAPSVEAVGRAVENVPGRPRAKKVNHGSYYMRFRIHVALP